MLFFWTREPTTATVTTTPHAGPWFAWFTTAMLFWRYRRRIARTFLRAATSLRLLKYQPGTATALVAKSHCNRQRHHRHSTRFRSPSTARIAVKENRRTFQQRKVSLRCQYPFAQRGLDILDLPTRRIIMQLSVGGWVCGAWPKL
jgi:hypothetical protein